MNNKTDDLERNKGSGSENQRSEGGNLCMNSLKTGG